MKINGINIIDLDATGLSQAKVPPATVAMTDNTSIGLIIFVSSDNCIRDVEWDDDHIVINLNRIE